MGGRVIRNPPLPLAGEGARTPVRRVRVRPRVEAEDHPHPLGQAADLPLPQAGEGGYWPPSRDFEQAGGAHAAGDAHRHDDKLGAAALAFDEGMADEA